MKTAEDNYLLYLRKREEARISDALDGKKIVNVTIAEAATVPVLPSFHLGWILIGGLAHGRRLSMEAHMRRIEWIRHSEPLMSWANT